MKKEEEILSRITGYSIQELHERLTEPILQPYDCLMAMIEFAEQQANGVNTSHEPALHKHDVVRRSEQLKAFANYVQGRMWGGEDKDLSEFVEEFLSL